VRSGSSLARKMRPIARSLASVWGQLRAYALTDARVDERAAAMVPFLQGAVDEAFPRHEVRNRTVAWICLEGLRSHLVRPGSELSPAEALALMEQTVRG
jgi:hypothetical protein